LNAGVVPTVTVYNDLVATAVILQNSVDMARIVTELKRDGWKISATNLSFLSPYKTAQ